MRSPLWPTAMLVAVLSCGDSSDPPADSPPTPSEFGLDERPVNPTCLAKARPVLDTGVQLERQWANIDFDTPIYMTQAPGDNDRWYVVQRGGTVRTLLASATTNDQVTDFATVTVNGAGEGGLLSMAFHPSWPSTPEAYMYYTRSVAAGDPAPVCSPARTAVLTSIVSRFRRGSDGKLGAADEILKVGQPFTNHKGGTVQFGNDGYLYLGLGDGGDGDDTCRAAQNLSSPLGKMLRIDVDAPQGVYRIPTDNPFVDTPNARKEIWAYGLRNPFRWSFDRASGDQWVGDVGQTKWEEIDRVERGGNYGWRDCEGFHERGQTADDRRCPLADAIDPIVEHPRSEATSITGGAVYRGTAMPSLVGTYIYGDYGSSTVWALTYDSNNKPTPRKLLTVAQLVAFGQGNDGELYTVQITGQISKLVPSSAAPPSDDFPALLSQTGCVDPADATRPAAGLIPYGVSSPLWSDGADKQRWFALPDGAQITINDEQDWDLPIGSVAMKTFSVAGKRIETRLFMRHDDGAWAGYTYEWNAAGTDAALLTAGKLRPLDGAATWTYPSRSQCLDCHSAAAGGTLGLETAQLNNDVTYPSTNRLANQLATLDHIGVLATALPATPPKLSAPAGADPLEDRARSYLHANCAHCHRPGGGGQGTMDLRYTQSFAATATCNADTTQGSIGGASKIVAPGMPEASALSLRVHGSDAKRMPPVAVSVVDELGTRVIDDWIRGLTSCPQ